MQTALEFPLGDVRDRVSAARQRSSRAPQELYPLLAAEIEALAERSFLRRASGSPDAGITWDPLTQHTLRWKRREGYPAAIGIGDGTLLESLDSAADSAGFEVGFSANFAPLFDAQRQLLPETLPAEWSERLDAAAGDWLADLLSFE